MTAKQQQAYSLQHRHDDTEKLRQELEKLLPEEFRTYIEQEFYAKVNARAVLDRVADNTEFLANPLTHVALYSDHGVVHVRDVALQILQVLDTINGILIPTRDKNRLGFMRGYGVMVAYLHDIGMRDFSRFGRAIHPEFAAQLVYKADFDDLVDRLWSENSGNVAWRLLNLAAQGDLPQDPTLLMREMLAMSVCHSKSKVPIQVLNDREHLRQVMRQSISTDLRYLNLRQQVEKADLKLRQAREQHKPSAVLSALADSQKSAEDQLRRFLDTEGENSLFNHDLSRYYPDMGDDSFLWLTDPKPALRDLALDVVDTLRALRCADALRQRGTTYKTSAGYETFIERRSASAIYALRNQDLSKLFFLRADNPVNAGEANVASSGIDREGNLRISLHCGSFGDAETTEKAARNAAGVINDIQEDVISSFRRAEDGCGDLQPPRKTAHDIRILIEGVDDNPDFARLVCAQLQPINPDAARQCRPVPSLQSAELEEIERYLKADERKWSMAEKRELLARLAESGRKVGRIDLTKAFADVKVIHLTAGEVLMSGGSQSGFVYVPFSTGLKIFPMGGYAPVSAKAWVSLGDTGVVRGSVRNATIVAEKDITLLMIPKSVYLEHWYDTYSPEEFSRLLAEGVLSKPILSG